MRSLSREASFSWPGKREGALRAPLVADQEIEIDRIEAQLDRLESR